MKKYVIIGASAAGLAAAEQIRKTDKTGDITVLTKESYLPYSRPSISYYLKGKVKESDMYLRKNAYYKTNNIKIVLKILTPMQKPSEPEEKNIPMTSFALRQAQSRLYRR